MLTTGPYPSRDVETNLADVAAQVAANRQGASDLLALVDRYSEPVVSDYMDFVQDAAEQKVRHALARLPIGTHQFVDYPRNRRRRPAYQLPSPSPFTAASHNPAATIDFTGTGPVVDGNLNANRAIVTAAVIYVLRLLIAEDIPLNHGVLRPIEIVLPECLLNPRPGKTPATTPAVAGGNVETSQRVVDVLLGALGLAGASQGTMNNVLFGDATFGYYETICGGSGATADAPGASAVQIHMTNTRSTDPEICRAPLPGARAGILDSPRLRRCRSPSRRRWRHPSTRVPQAARTVAARRAPRSPSALRNGRRQARRGRSPPIDSPRRHNENTARNRSAIRGNAGDVLVIETPGGGGFGEVTATTRDEPSYSRRIISLPPMPSQPHFADALAAAVKQRGNPVVVGLDPRWESLPAGLRSDSDELV